MSNAHIKGLTKHKRAIVDQVCSLIAEEFAIDREDLFKKSRASRYSIPRSVAAGILRLHYGIQHQVIADYFGYASHSSVAHAVRSVDNKMKTNPELVPIIQSIVKSVKINDN